MTTSEKFKIHLTTDAKIVEDCALMMSKSDPWITLGIEYPQCLDAFKGFFKEIYVMEVGKEIVGFSILQTCGTFKGYIQTICIRDVYRGKGLGKELLLFCEERVFKISPNIFICVSSFNQRAIKLYYNFGFKLVGPLENFIKPGVTELLLRKSIGPITGYPFQPMDRKGSL